MATQIIEKTSEAMISYEIHGYVDENVKFPPMKFAPTIRISLEKVTGLNSVGTREWCGWISQIGPPTLIRVEFCPLIFVKCFNSVKGALAENMQIMSFYVPFFSEELGERKNVLLVRGVNFHNDADLKFPEVIDSKGKPMEMDVLSDYFRFLGA